MNKISLIILLMIFFVQTVFGQNVVITGNAKTYAGKVLQWRSYSDQITFHEKILAESKVNAKGDFKFEINVDKPLISFIHLNVFKGILFIEPGKSYQIVLPERQEKSKADELNPFFKETEFFIRCVHIDSSDLNVKIKMFDKLLDSYMTESFKQFKGKVNKTTVDSIINLIEKKFSANQNEYFNNYRKYNYASYRLVAYERNKERFITTNFSNKKILWNNPAYMDLFNRVFYNYLKTLYRKPKGKAIPYNLIKRKSLSGLKSCLDSFPYLQNDTLKDLVILKSLYDNFYKDDFPHESILFMIDSVQYDTDVPEVRLIAKNIKQKLTTLLLNYQAPDFKLKNSKGKSVSLSNYKGSFVYLNFCTPGSYSCQKDFRLLQQLHLQQYELLKIVTICVCDSYESMKKLVKENKYRWDFLYFDKNNELLQKYNVRVYPSYYLINPEGKLIMLPAFPPGEASFEARYFDALKSWKRELLRREQKKKNQQGLGNH